MSNEVDDWFEHYDNPMRDVVESVRQVILSTDEVLEECIKWRSPTFTYKGNIASFNPRSKKHASLMFHTGAHIPGTFASLEGNGDTARYLRFADLAEVDAMADELRAIVRAWIDWKG